MMKSVKQLITFLIVCPLAVFWSWSVLASSDGGRLSTTFDSLKNEVVKDSSTILELGHQSYVSSDQLYFKSRGASSGNTTIGLSVDDKMLINDKCESLVDGHFFYSLDEDHSYINPKSIYIGCRYGRNLAVDFGRVSYSWSQADSFWMQGLITPRFLWSKADPTEQGLTGIYIYSKDRLTNWTLFASPLYIPDMGPGFEEHNGKLLSNNVWFRPPIGEMELFGKSHDVRVQVANPSIKDVIQQFSVGGRIEREHGGNRWSGGFLRKPMNQLQLGFPISVNIQPVINVTITPEVKYHSVVWGEVEKSLDRKTNLWLSVSHDIPDSVEEKEGWVQQAVDPSTVFSGAVFRRFIGSGPYATQGYFGFYKLLGGENRDKGEFSGDQSYFESRFFLKEAVKVGISQPIFGRWLGLDWSSESDLIYDTIQEGAIFKGKLNAAIDASKTLEFNFVSLGLIGEKESSGFFSDYRSNDYLELRYKYVY